jgi:hypothetical protein
VGLPAAAAARGELRGAVSIVRHRAPERFRWRRAVGLVSQTAGVLLGRDRMRVEEPIRELVLDLGWSRERFARSLERQLVAGLLRRK